MHLRLNYLKKPAFKLIYFKMHGIGEPIRLLLTYGGQEFEDIRLMGDSEEWQKMKPNTPFGTLPILEFEGKRFAHQHLAIARYLAKQYKLVGDNDWEDLQIDSVVDTLSDLKEKVYTAIRGPDCETVKMNREEVSKNTLPFYFERLNELPAVTSGYLANGKLSWADLYFFSYQESFNTVTKCKFVDKYPNLRKVIDNVLAIPNIKTWVGKRPRSPY